jgi:hypothetical protein
MNSNDKIADEIRNLVAKAQLEKALDLFIKSDFPQAASIKKRFENAQLLVKKGKLDFGDYNIVRNNIVDSLLKALDGETPSEISNNFRFDTSILGILREEKPQRILSESEKSLLKQLLDQNKIEKALLACHGLGNKFMALTSSYAKMKRDDNLGLLTTAEKNRRIDDIKAAIQKAFEG